MNRKIFHGDAFKEIEKIGTETIDCVITSPPYYALRDYGVDMQVGLEKTTSQYLALLQEMMTEIHRVLKPTGTAWINLGDSYANGGDGGGQLRPKCRYGIPERFYVDCIQSGDWLARNHICWTKTNPMPSSVKDRFTNAWESVFFFAKEPKYYFNLDAVRAKSKAIALPFNVRVRNAKDGTQSEKLSGKVTAAEKDSHNKVGGKMRRGRRANNTKLNNRNFLPINSHRKTIDPSKATQTINRVVSGGYDVTTGQPLNHPRGKNPGDVLTADYTDEELLGWIKECRQNRAAWNIAPPDLWYINPKPFPEAHTAVFPIALPKWILSAACPPGGIVLDPFFGAGTTAVAAEQLGLQWVGIELNQEYIGIARKRLEPYQNARLVVEARS